MIKFFEKDSATIIVIDCPTIQEKQALVEIKKYLKESERKASMFAHFKCNQGKAKAITCDGAEHVGLEDYVPIGTGE